MNCEVWEVLDERDCMIAMGEIELLELLRRGTTVGSDKSIESIVWRGKFAWFGFFFFRSSLLFSVQKIDIHYQTSNSQLLGLFAKISFATLKNIDDILE